LKRIVLVTVMATLLASGGSVHAQAIGDHRRWESTTWVDDLNFASVNVLVAGLTGGISGYLRGGSFSDGFSRGALGGGVEYLGKRISAADFDGAGLLGRQVGAVGASMVRNASLDVGLLDSLIVPIGPVRARVAPSALGQAAFRLDLHEAVWLVYALTEQRLEFDWGRTVSSGVPVFLTNSAIQVGDDGVNGLTGGGLIVLSRRSSSDLGNVMAHERVHVLQVDFLKTSIGYPVESWVGRRAGLGDLSLLDHLLFGLAHGLVLYPLGGAWDRARSLIEVEADFLEAR